MAVIGAGPFGLSTDFVFIDAKTSASLLSGAQEEFWSEPRFPDTRAPPSHPPRATPRGWHGAPLP